VPDLSFPQLPITSGKSARLSVSGGKCPERYSASAQTANSTSKRSTPSALNAATRELSDLRRISRSASHSR
jgi:hypothetical protein